MKIRVSALTGLLVAVVLFTQTVLGQDLRQFAKITLGPNRGQSRHQVERARAPQGLSVKERLKRGQEMIRQELPASNPDRFRASVDVSEPIELDGEKEMLELSTVFFGNGNFRTATTTVDLWRWPATERSYLTFTGEFITPGLRDNVWGGIVWHYSFGRQGRK